MALFEFPAKTSTSLDLQFLQCLCTVIEGL